MNTVNPKKRICTFLQTSSPLRRVQENKRIMHVAQIHTQLFSPQALFEKLNLVLEQLQFVSYSYSCFQGCFGY